MDLLRPEQVLGGGDDAATNGTRCMRPGERVCDVQEMTDGGRGVRFMLNVAGELRSAFVVRLAGQVYGYLNECAHRGIELDWVEGEFFDAYRQFLVCASHGARYDPESGACIDGLCAGRSLFGLPLEIVGSEVRLARDLSVPSRTGQSEP
ncbi:MAG: Rieske (2Fe-2S) protein [Acidiferrobacterales bacterium]